jgi:hypothetical protein
MPPKFDWPDPNVKVMPNDGDLVDLIPLFAPERELQHKSSLLTPRACSNSRIDSRLLIVDDIRLGV